VKQIGSNEKKVKESFCFYQNKNYLLPAQFSGNILKILLINFCLLESLQPLSHQWGSRNSWQP
jgi:hypothetical protein